MNEYGLMAGPDRVVRVDSRMVADVFEKEHFHVLHDIERITDAKSGLSEEFRKSNYGFSTYVEDDTAM